MVNVRDFVGGRACGIFSKDAISKNGVTHYYCGADPDFIRQYSETYSQFDPLTVLPRYGKVVSIPDLVVYDEYRRGRFYQEWLEPQGSVDAANVVLERTSSSCPVLLTVLSGKRMVDKEMRRRISMIVPHANRALMINKAIELKKSETKAIGDVLDGLNAGIFLLDANCRIVHANTAGHSLLLADDYLRDVGGQLFTGDAQLNKRLRQIFGAIGETSRVADGTAFALNDEDGQRYVAHVLPLASVLRDGAERSFKAVGVLFVRQVQANNQPCDELIARSFDLTPAEMRVLQAIVEVGGVPESAQALGIAVSTVKTHLSRVFAKTGTSRQADLVKLAAEFSSPFMA
jgi:DNA-binding CsgD family transcriptional regulator